MRRLPLFVAAGLTASATPALAADLAVSIELPRIASASYHRPYVAVWIERPDESAVRTLAVWYNQSLPNQEGKDWLRDIRTWWRKAGRELRLPADGVSGATRAPGRHQVLVAGERLRDLPPGRYVLAVEAARELGGRELVRVPFQWGGANRASASGAGELGAVAVTVTR